MKQLLTIIKYTKLLLLINGLQRKIYSAAEPNLTL